MGLYAHLEILRSRVGDYKGVVQEQQYQSVELRQ